MDETDELKFNCVEKVLMQVNNANPMPPFNESCMKIASIFGGGVGGSRNICGAVIGAAMAIGLALGTSGIESPAEFKMKRKKGNELIKNFILKLLRHGVQFVVSIC